MKVSGATALMESLVKEGVDVLFGYPGGAIMPAYDALYDFRDKIRHILVRHEQGAAHAAEGYARVAGKPGVCLVTSGPGATNLVTGIADAMLDSVPIVCITGQVGKALLGTDAFQETDIIGITTPITKWNYQITSADEIPKIIAKAFYIARTGRPGPVLIDITKNAQVEPVEFEHSSVNSLMTYTPRVMPDKRQVERAAELLNEAKRPYILIGHGILISSAEEALRSVVEKSGIPVSSTLLGLSAFPTDHPLFVGMLGMHGNYGPNLLSNRADVLLAVGMRFDDRVTGKLSEYLPQTRVIHIDIDPAEIHKNVRAEVPIIGDARLALEELLPLLKKNQHSDWVGEFHSCYKTECEKVINRELHPQSGPITMAETVRLISEKTNGEAVIVADVGQHQMIAARYYRFKYTNSFITSGGLGTMGFALPAAFGAKVGVPNRQVVGIIGDGCIQMTLQELGTIAQEKTPVKIVVLNNNFLGMVRQWQQLFFDNRYSFVHLENPNFVKICEGFGIEAERVDDRKDLAGALKRMLDCDKPYFLDVRVAREDNVFPMVSAGSGVADVRLE